MPGRRLLIACDFDGTITRNDTLVEILDRFGSSDWRKVQAKVVSGEISIREGLRAEMGSVRASPDELKELLTRRIQLDPTFGDFFRTIQAQGIPLVLLTGGFDLCVETVMRQAGIWPIPSLSNRLRWEGGTWEVDFPYPSSTCQACGHCKGDPIRTWNGQGYTTIFAGNGVTDRCAARAASLTFAKEELGDWCRKQGIPAMDFQSFSDIENGLRRREWI